MTAESPSRQGTGFSHQGLLFDRDAELLTVAMHIARDAAVRGEHVILVCSDERNELLHGAMQGHAPVTALTQREVYTRAGATVDCLQQLVAEKLDLGATGVQALGEVPFGDDPRHWREWAQYESVLNHALAGLPVSSVCAYDIRDVHPLVLDTVRSTHPYLRTGASIEANDHYVPPETYLVELAEPVVLEVEESDPALVVRDIDGVRQLRMVRERLSEFLVSIDTALRPEAGDRPPASPHWLEAEDFVYAVHEVVKNAVTHGEPPATVEAWVADQDVIVRVTDHGSGFTDPFAGFSRKRTGDSASATRMSQGLWLARQLCDDLSFRSDQGRFTVRLRATLDVTAP
ncbi:MAG TPA: sensor histidine kinase [Marmoricola sp.]|nr:sensor histidine kinase [Marmoricola sp.]